MEFTFNNHLKYTIKDRSFGFRKTPYEKYQVSVGKIDLDYYQKNTWKTEQYRIGSLVLDNLGKDFVLLYSGLNSELILRILLSLNIKPILIFIRFVGNYNLEEYYHAVKTANDLGIELSVFDYDIVDNFHSGELTEFADSFQCSTIMQAVLCHSVHKLQSPTIIGQKTIFRKKITLNNVDWYYSFPETANASNIRYSLKYHIPVISEWFSYTPESIAYLLDNIDLNSETYKFKLSTNSTQNQIFNQLIPKLTITTHKTGYENLYGLMTEFLLRGSRFHGGFDNNIDGINLKELKTQLYGDGYDNS
jgi:hypothetical protein